VETACALIKAADDAAADRDYMLDSDDCIAVLRGTWKAPLANDMPKQPTPTAQPAVQEPVAWLKRHELADLQTCNHRRLGADSPRIWAPNAPDAPPPELDLVAVYTTPPAAQRQWVGLTDDAKLDLISDAKGIGGRVRSDAQLLVLLDMQEAKLKEKQA
jgi:hypothetical protein